MSFRSFRNPPCRATRAEMAAPILRTLDEQIEFVELLARGTPIDPDLQRTFVTAQLARLRLVREGLAEFFAAAPNGER